jgi:hypothetical protein
MHQTIVPTLFDYSLSMHPDSSSCISLIDAQKLFKFFSTHPLFKWRGSHNGCEARTDAMALILQSWAIPHNKGWVFGGKFLKNHVGTLINNWNYHVAVLVTIREQTNPVHYIIDPGMANGLQALDAWAAATTLVPHSYHFISPANWYIFHHQKICKATWHLRNRQNRKWMIQGLAGINSLNALGKAALCFNKKRICNTADAFRQMKLQCPL